MSITLLDEFPDSCYDATLGISSTKDISEPIGTVREALQGGITLYDNRQGGNLLKSQKSIVFKCNAAFQLAMCAEYMYEFEASTRYDSDFVLDSDIYSIA